MSFTGPSLIDLGPAIVRYDQADYHVLDPRGEYVLCAVSGRRIPLDRLTYWSAALQEAYAGPAEATKRLTER
jgi:hypothetical protein